ncbi:Asp-tRNA(Asn)/Glu-tRNA(Gln) amidotransferase subunit GatA [Candidatus Dependentiae bacterium]|nr:Asp-tRNA(Asn)/Glu-tRNA(Gln) amidotransferase subunit GatA [Candidatus Dependentiae bacterium]
MKPFMTIKELLYGLETKQFSAEEITKFYQDRIEKYNPTLNAFLEQFETETIKTELYGSGLLAGIPGALKNNISIENRTITCGSKILQHYKAPYSATVTDRLRQEGSIILGTTNMDEFAMGASGEFSAYGAIKNPWDTERTPGGSSSGSAAAVAAGLVPWALGTETGGSIRQPASFCGLVGLYPTYGLFSRYGLVAFASSTDQPAPLTKTVYDNALIASALSGHDPKDSSSLPEPARDFTKNLDGKLPKNLTIGVIKNSLKSDGVDNQVKIAFERAIKHLEHLGATVKTVELPDMRYGIQVYFILAYAEAASNLSRFDGTLYGTRAQGTEGLLDMYIQTRHDGFGSEVKRRILMGNYVLSSSHKEAYYKKASHIRSAIRAAFDNAFEHVDLLLSPTVATPPFKLGELCDDPIAMYLSDYFTVPNCITGMPALSLPCGYTKEKLPIGFQFIGPRLSEEKIYRAAYAYEQSTDFHLKNPRGYE